MRMKTLIAVISIALCASSTTAMARTVASADGHSDHKDHFGHHRHHHGHLFLAVPYGWDQPGAQSEDDQSGIVAYPQAAPRSDVTGATTSQPCSWREQRPVFSRWHSAKRRHKLPLNSGLLSEEEARSIAEDIAKLPEL